LLDLLNETFEPTGVGSLFFLLLPLLICCLASTFLRGGSASQAQATTALEVDSWFTPKNINDAFNEVCKEVDRWREQSTASTSDKKVVGRFRVLQSIPPRLHSVFDEREGEITFELTKVEGGGTSVRVKYSPTARQRIYAFRAQSDVKVPSALTLSCPSCGRSVLKDYEACPYCGSKLK